MSDNLKKYSFQDLLKQGKIRIPKIQRDYAQGRLNKNINEIRKVFIHQLLLVVKGKKGATELDFVYGSNYDNAFEPLDGQQRLTTLFLLHWMMGVNVSINDENKEAIFSYETRNTSKEFCDELVQHNALQLIEEAQTKKKTLSHIIQNRDWFKWEWRSDPTIFSMLVVMDSIFEEMDWTLNLNNCRENLKNITFNLLNLGDFGLSNELFIKMNARGKQLSDFDKLKSSFEEELQLQQKEYRENSTYPLATAEEETDWRTFMDGDWIDFFWKKYVTSPSINLECAKKAEKQFKKLLLRLIAIQILESKNANEKLKTIAYEMNEDKIDNLFFEYTNSLIVLRNSDNYNIGKDNYTIDFKKLIQDINLLICKNDEFSFYIDPNRKNSLLELFLDEKVPNDVALVFYTMLLFLRKFSVEKTDKEELVNLEHWVIAMRNILSNDNNNRRIDKILLFENAVEDLNTITNDLAMFTSEKDLNIKSCDSVVKQFFGSIKEEKTYQGLDNQSLLEEVEKAKLVLINNEWENALKEAENHPYLWGQIRCLLNWAKKDINLFKDYSKQLLSILNFLSSSEKEANLFYLTMLTFEPYHWKETNRLYRYNRDRDNSFKRYLRTKGKEEIYAFHLKGLIDVWRSNYKDLTVGDFIATFIKSKKEDPNLPIWIKCIIEYPLILNEAWEKRIYEKDKHIILAQRKTLNSHCFDIILLYFRELCKYKGIDRKNYTFCDSDAELPHSFELKIANDIYLIQWKEKSYIIKKNDKELNPTNETQVVPFITNLIETNFSTTVNY